MELEERLEALGFGIENASQSDLGNYIAVKKACYKKYVERYYGGWDEADQIARNTAAFEEASRAACFRKIMLCAGTVGFIAYDAKADRIDGVSVQMLPVAQGRGVGSAFMEHLTSLARSEGKPVFLKVFLDNPAKNLYERFGFKEYDRTPSHCLMRYDPPA